MHPIFILFHSRWQFVWKRKRSVTLDDVSNKNLIRILFLQCVLFTIHVIFYVIKVFVSFFFVSCQLKYVCIIWNQGISKVKMVFEIPIQKKDHCFSFLLSSGNIPGSRISNGQILCEYLPPVPVQGTGFHRFVFCLIKQNGELDLSNYVNKNPRW